MARIIRTAVVILTFLGASTAIKISNKSVVVAGPQNKSVVVAVAGIANKSVVAVTQKDVDGERMKLDKMAVMLGGMLKSEGLSHSKIAPALKLFADNLETVLNASKSMKPSEAMKAMAAAKVGITGLVGEMTNHQESLMREDFQQREELLMGVLMNKKNAPMKEQLEILENEDFAGLDVSKELLKANNQALLIPMSDQPLYIQAAQYLDTHKNASGVVSHASHEKSSNATAAVFDKRVTALENEAKVKEMTHKKKVQKLTDLAKKATGKSATMMNALVKRENHQYKKAAASAQHDIASMKEAAAALHSGDMKALNHARAALQQSLDALKNKNGAMLVFLQQAHRILEKDCPYCAAQCVEKCHNNGKAYVACLGECADAGKGF